MDGDPPRRTGKTALSDDELILLDAMVVHPAPQDSLEEDGEYQYELGYEHGLKGDAVERTLRRLEEQKLVRKLSGEGEPCFELTEEGGKLWEEERAPDWDAFCCWTILGEEEEFDEDVVVELVFEGEEERARHKRRIKEGVEQYFFVVRSPSAETARACLEARIECGFEDAFLSRRFARLFVNRRILPWKAFDVVYEFRAPYNPDSNDSDEDREQTADWDSYERRCTWWSEVRDLCDFPRALTIRLGQPAAPGRSALGDRELEAEARSLEGHADRVRDAILHETGITDAGLKLLLPFRRLRELHLEDTAVTDRGLAACSAFKELEGIILTRTRITDAGIAALAGLKEVRRVCLDSTCVGDGALETLAGFPRLEVLSLGGTRVTGAGLAAVSRMSRLEWLSLAGTGIGDADIPRLAALVGLKSLDFSRTAVTDAGLAHLAAFPQLLDLRLNGTAVGDAGLAHLATLPKLENLHLNGTAVTDAGIARLASYPNLMGLFLSDTAITDAALGHLASLPRLGWLALKRTAVTDAGLLKLRGLKELHVLSLAGTRVTRTGVARLREHLTRLVLSEEVNLPGTEDL